MMNRRALLAGLLALPAAARATSFFNVNGHPLLVNGGIFSIPAAAPAIFDYYIGPSGSDSNAGTIGSPWAVTSLIAGHGNNGLIAGKKVGLLNGTYNLNVGGSGATSIMCTYGTAFNQPALDIPAGTALNPTVIAAVNARQAILNAFDSGSGNYGTQATGAQAAIIGQANQNGHVTLDGLVLNGAWARGVSFGDLAPSTTRAPGITVQNCEMTNQNGYGASLGSNLCVIELNSADSPVIQNNYAHACYGYSLRDSDHMAFITTWATINGTFQFNTVIDAGTFQAKREWQWGNLVQNNYVDMTGWSGPELSEALVDWGGPPAPGDSSPTGTTFIHNILISENGTDFVAQTSEIPWTTPLNFINNTMVAAGGTYSTRGFLAASSNTSPQFTIYNNMLVSGGGFGNHGIMALDVPKVILLDYQMYPTSTTWTQASIESNSYSTLAAWRTYIGADAHSFQSNTANFVGTPTGLIATAYKLGAGSAALGAGKSNGLVGGSACDLGAWGGATPPTRIGCDFV